MFKPALGQMVQNTATPISGLIPVSKVMMPSTAPETASTLGMLQAPSNAFARNGVPPPNAFSTTTTSTSPDVISASTTIDSNNTTLPPTPTHDVTSNTSINGMPSPSTTCRTTIPASQPFLTHQLGPYREAAPTMRIPSDPIHPHQCLLPWEVSGIQAAERLAAMSDSNWCIAQTQFQRWIAVRQHTDFFRTK
jgi:hypothetical protein